MPTPPASLRSSAFFRSLLAALVLAAALASGCTEAPPVDPSALGPGNAVLTIVPALAYRGAEQMSAAQGDALNQAFNRVDHFRLVIRRASSNELVKDTVIAVTPGKDVYDLSVSVPSVAPNESFLVAITALQGDVVLFQSKPIAVQAVAENAAGPASTPKVELDYAGPGADAASVTIVPTPSVLAPGGTRTVNATVRTAAGAVVPNVPISWTSASTAVATISNVGALAGIAEGATQITATTPTGISTTGWVYVVAGEVTFAQGGHIRSRQAAGGTITDVTPGASDAGQPSSGPGGLVYSAGGQAFVGGRAVTAGSWPSVSPDGSKLAVERGGQVWFTNMDGSNPTPGPGGSTPIWLDGSFLIVGGGSVQRVRADGTARTTIGSGTTPTLGPSGQLAFVSGGALTVQGRSGGLLSGVTGRPAWSPNARWLVAPAGGDLMLVDAVGSAPPVALGIAGAGDAAWAPGPSGSAAAPSIGSLEPAKPVPGTDVRLVGNGFDWIIPANNSVFFPSPSGPVAGPIRSVTETRITVGMPLGTTAGSIRVVTKAGQSTIAFVPAFGSIKVSARLPGDAPAPGMGVTVLKGAATAASGTTNSSGEAQFDLEPGDYVVSLSPSSGFRVVGPSSVSVSLGFEPKTVSFDLVAVPDHVTLSPEAPLVDIGTPVAVHAKVFDAAGRELTSFRSIRWAGTARVEASGGTLDGQLQGLKPSSATGDAPFAIVIDGQPFEFAATVTSSIAGNVSQSPDGGGTPVPLDKSTVRITDGSGRVKTTTTNAAGNYRLGGLLAGTYTVTADVPTGYGVSPTSRTVTLGTPATGQNFVLARNYIEGRVVESGASAASVTVRLFASGSETALATTTTDADGKYKFPALVLGSYVVSAAPATGKLVNPTSRGVTLDAAHTFATGQDFTIYPTSIAGTAKESGAGASGVTVKLYTAGTSVERASTTTGTGGSYTFSGIGGGGFDIKVTASAGKLVSPTSRTVTIDTNTPSATGQDFTVYPTSISGTVKENGVGASGVTVKLYTAGTTSEVGSTTTASGGTFTFSGMGGGSFEIKPTPPANKIVSPTSRAVTVDTSTPSPTGQDFTLTGYYIEGSVSLGGSPLAGVTVRLYVSGSESPLASVNTGSDGTYKFEGLSVGAYTIKPVVTNGRVANPPSRGIALSSSAPNANGQTFTLYETSIEGTVTESGSPSSGITVKLSLGGSQVAQTTTNSSGVYRFTAMGEGTFSVSIVPPSGKTVSPTSISVSINGNAPTASGQNFTLTTIPSGEPMGVLRPNVMVCGYNSHSVTTFFPAGTSFTVLSGCVPDSNTQALFITRGGAYSINASGLQAYVNAGGVIVTEYNISHIIWNAVFGTNVGLGYQPGTGYRYGYCKDILPSVVQYNPSDPFWAGVTYQPMTLSDTGCGYSVGHFPGITKLAGWDSGSVSLGYRNLGSGRVWAADFDWQDNESYPYKAYTEKALGYMMTHRGGGGGGAALRVAPDPLPAANADRSAERGIEDTRAISAAGVQRPEDAPAQPAQPADRRRTRPRD